MIIIKCFLCLLEGDDDCMKQIIIDKTVVYEPLTHSLYIIGNKSTQIVLAIPASLCFFVLLDNHGKIVTHNGLLSSVWQSRGMEVSPNTVYQNISILRKSLVSLGLTGEIITTVPKRGFVISENILIENIDDEKPIESLKIKNEKLSPEVVKDEEIMASPRNKILLTILIFVLLISLLGWFFLPSHKDDIKGTHFSGFAENCPVYTFDKIPNDLTNTLITSLNKRIPKALLYCKKNEILLTYLPGVFYHDVNENLDEYFIARCLRQKNSLISCESYYSDGGKTQ